jgi:hypothetical protein
MKSLKGIYQTMIEAPSAKYIGEVSNISEFFNEHEKKSHHCGPYKCKAYN